MILAFPFDNTEYSADALGTWFSTRTRGVFCADSNLRVVANNNATVTVKKGIAWLKMRDDWGVVFNNTEDYVLNLERNNTSETLRCAIICQIDKYIPEARLTTHVFAAGAAPAPTRNEQYDEIILATVTLRPKYTSVSAAEITDTRLNEALCGLMRDGVTQLPTSALQEQAQQLLDALAAQLERLNAGSEVMLKSVYDPDSTGTVLNAKRAQAVPWMGVEGRPSERFIRYTGDIGGAFMGTFILVGSLFAHKFGNIWRFDFSGTKFTNDDFALARADYGIKITSLQQIVNAPLRAANDLPVGTLQIFYGRGTTVDVNFGKYMNTETGLHYGGLLTSHSNGFLRPSRITSQAGKIAVCLQNQSPATTTSNDQWIATFYLEET